MDSLAVDLRLSLGRVSRRLRRLYTDADEGPSFLELAVLLRLERNGPSTPSELAGAENVTSAAVAASLAKLDERGMIRRTRDAKDRRRVVLTLSAQGRRTLRKREDVCVAKMSQVLAAFTERERKSLSLAIPVLERLAKEL